MYLRRHNTRNNSQKRFNFLPSHLVIDICSYLDNESQLNAILAFDKWIYAFGSSSKLMDNFSLDLNKEFFNKHRIQDLPPNFPVKNVTISIDKDNFKPSFFVRTLKKYHASIINVKFYDAFIDTPNFVKLLDAVKNVTHLELNDVTIDEDYPIELPKLKSLKISSTCYVLCSGSERTKQWITNFKNNQSIEKLHLGGCKGNCSNWSPDDTNSVVSALPNLKHLIMNNCGWDQPLDGNFPAKLETLGVSTLYNCPINFLRTQMDTLKDLKIIHYGYHDEMYGNGEIFDFIFNEMNLRNFQCRCDKLIVNYERQPKSMQIDNEFNDDSSDNYDSE